jgi:NAD(P)-dependent dehydrogenase (short-subunit alcohol dehydrogenase family)
VSNAVLFLLQNGARFITGETLILDGGATWLE